MGCDIVGVVEDNTIKSIYASADGYVSQGKLCIKGKYVITSYSIHYTKLYDVGLQSLTGKDGSSAILVDHNTFVMVSVVSMLAGTMMLMWIGEQITQSGIGNSYNFV